MAATIKDHNLPNDLLKRVEYFQFLNCIKNRTDSIKAFLEKGLEQD